MRSRETMMLFFAMACLVWSGFNAWERLSNAHRSREDASSLIRVDEKNRKTIARMTSMLAYAPVRIDTDDATLSPLGLLAKAGRNHVKVEQISEARGEVQARLSGLLAGIMEMLDATTRSATLKSAGSGDEIAMDATFGPKAVVKTGVDAGYDAEYMERALARYDSAPVRDSTIRHDLLAMAFRSEARSNRNHVHGDHAGDIAMYALSDDNVGGAGVVVNAGGLRYLGAISGGVNGPSGIFQDARGLVIKVNKGGELADWRIVSIEANAATLSRDELSGRTIRLEQSGLN